MTRQEAVELIAKRADVRYDDVDWPVAVRAALLTCGELADEEQVLEAIGVLLGLPFRQRFSTGEASAASYSFTTVSDPTARGDEDDTFSVAMSGAIEDLPKGTVLWSLPEASS